MKESSHIPLNALTSFPLHIRVEVDEEKLEGLAGTFKSHGVLEPLVVRPSKSQPDKFEVVCGVRRFLAAQKAGLTTVPCIVREMNDLEASEATLIENLQRVDLTDYELGRWFKLLMERFPDNYPNLQAVADKFGYKDVAIVSRLISHYEFITNIASSLPSNILPRGKMLPETIIREVRRAPENFQPKILKAVVNEQMRFERGETKYTPSVRDVAELVDSYIRDWEREREAEVVEPSEVAEPSVLKEPAVPAKPIEVSKPKLPSEAEVEERLEETIKKRREARRQEKFSSILYTYYPERFLLDLEKFFDFNAPEEKILAFINYVIEIAWERLDDAVKMAIIQEARSWMR